MNKVCIHIGLSLFLLSNACAKQRTTVMNVRYVLFVVRVTSLLLTRVVGTRNFYPMLV